MMRGRLKDLITQNEIERIREKTKIGETVTWMVLTGSVDSTMAQYPVQPKKLKINGKYRHVVTAVDPTTGIEHSKTWQELVMERREKRGGN